RCERVVADGYCVVRGFCTPERFTNPYEECEECNPNLDPWDWSPKENGTECVDEGNDCTDDKCAGGACRHVDKVSGAACGDASETECDYADSCDGAGTCLDNPAQAGTACGDATYTTC
ncbi:MAG: hypothetical protein JSU63_08835, partial [Phycisphaerales bacterium]